MFAKLKEMIEEYIREKERREAEKKMKELIGKVVCAVILCFVGVLIFKHRKPILAAILGKALLGDEEPKCSFLKLFG